MKVHLESFSRRANENLILPPLPVADDVFGSRSMRGFGSMRKYGTLVHHIGNFRPGVVV